MDYDAVLTTGVNTIPAVQQFAECFPNAEHVIVRAKRDLGPDGWQIVNEWISRVPLHERYIVWFVVAVQLETEGRITLRESPELYVVEIEKVVRCRNDPKGPSWQFSLFEFEDGDGEKLVANQGDFSKVGLDLAMNAPVDRFAQCYIDTRPTPLNEPPPDGMAFKAPLRFMTQ